MSPYYWMHYEKTEPKAVKNGLKAKSKRGCIGETWWSKRWVSVLESFNMGARLNRGKSYARKGQVICIDVMKGSVRAKVQGTFPNPYEVAIKLKPLSVEQWNKAEKVMSEKAAFSAHLLSGQMPQNIEEAFSDSGISLFPSKKADLKTDCTCPDWSNPCKHIAAVYFLLAEEFDRDPFLIFKLRGKGKEELMEELRALRCQYAGQEACQLAEEVGQRFSESEEVKPLEECLESYWQMGSAMTGLQINPRRPDVENAVLKRLGDSPIAIGRSNLTALLSEAYSLAGKMALDRALGDDELRDEPK